jgi:hypothetical protein
MLSRPFRTWWQRGFRTPESVVGGGEELEEGGEFEDFDVGRAVGPVAWDGDAIPSTSVGKSKKTALREQFADWK